MRHRPVPRLALAIGSLAAFLGAATLAVVAAEAQVGGFSGAPVVRPPPPALNQLAIPSVFVRSITSPPNLTVYLRNVGFGARAGSYRVKMVRTVGSVERRAFLTVSTWTADTITATVPAAPFGTDEPWADDGVVDIGITTASGAWIGLRGQGFLDLPEPPPRVRPAGCANPDFDGDRHNALECGGDDCDDASERRHPGLAEVCDSETRDEDCDPTTFGLRDADGDGSFDIRCCNVDAAGHRICGDDCDDANRGVYRNVPETCDQVDNDCDGTIDEGVQSILFRDNDRDGFGDPNQIVRACTWSDGLSYVNNDCDDTRRDVFMGHGCS